MSAPGDWVMSALCAQTDGDLWFPDKGGGTGARRALLVCAGCTVRRQCLDDALAHHDVHGIWGGRTPGMRRHMRRIPAGGAA